MNRYKCVFTIGPESSGSMLAARIIADALNIQQYGDWNAVGWIDHGKHKVCHRSLPYNIPPQYPDIEKWIKDNTNYDIYFVITTRDITISEISRIHRFNKNHVQVRYESERAQEIIKKILDSEQKSFIFSYESFMFLGDPYLQRLYRFLDIDSDFMPEISDGNRKRLIKS